jgi:hypothetical protein
VEHAEQGRRIGVSRASGQGGAPLWLRAVYRLERAVGEPLEAALHSDTYFDAVTELLRARHSYGRAAEGLSRRLLHLLNLPAGSDIRRVREQLGRMERRLSELSKGLEALEAGTAERHAAQSG